MSEETNIIKFTPSNVQKWISGEKASLEQLYVDLEDMAYSSNLAIILNQPPNPKWVKEHPTAKGPDKKPAKYIPIEKLEFMMDFFFGTWYVEVLREGIIANSAYVAVRVHYKHPSGEMRFVDGVGAMALQTNSGASATDWTQIKSGAVMMGLPAAKTYAIKDAIESLGRIFGKDLNRRDLANYDVLLGTEDKPRFTEEMLVGAPNLNGDEPPVIIPDDPELNRLAGEAFPV